VPYFITDWNRYIFWLCLYIPDFSVSIMTAALFFTASKSYKTFYMNLPRSQYRIIKMMIVVKQPPPSVFAPHPAISVRNKFLILAISSFYKFISLIHFYAEAITVPIENRSK